MKLHFDEFGFGGRESADTMRVPASESPAIAGLRDLTSEVRIRVDARAAIIRKRTKVA